MLTFDTHISKRQQVLVFAFLCIVLGAFVIFAYQSYVNDQPTLSVGQGDPTITSPAPIAPPVTPTPPPTQKPTATMMISVTEASDEKSTEDTQE